MVRVDRVEAAIDDTDRSRSANAQTSRRNANI
jgi:hypothetical protein